MAVLRNLIITATGDLGPKKSMNDMRKWVENNGGTWVPKITKSTTHVICSLEHWTKGSALIEQAKRFGSHIVTFDWLEESLQARRKESEKKFLLRAVEKKLRKENQKKKIKMQDAALAELDAQKFKAGCKMAETDLGSTHGGGFFRSSIADLAKRREEREREQQKAQLTKTGVTPPTTPKAKPSKKTAAGLHKKSSQTPPLSSEDGPPPQIPATTAYFTPSSPKGRIDEPTEPPATAPANINIIHIQSAGEARDNIANLQRPKLTDLYHIYLDADGFEYNVMLVRTNQSLNSNWRYRLRLYESNIKPHVYCTFIEYQPATKIKVETPPPIVPTAQQPQPKLFFEEPEPGPSTYMKDPPAPPSRKPADTQDDGGEHSNSNELTCTPPYPTSYFRPSPQRKLIARVNSSFHDAYLAFRNAFRTLTLFAWEERLPPRLLPGNVEKEDAHRLSRARGSELQHSRAQAAGIEPFLYAPPKMGAPRGNIPPIAVTELPNLVPSVRDFKPLTDLPGLPGAMQVKLDKDSGAIGRRIFDERMAEKVKMEKEEEGKRGMMVRKKKRTELVVKDGVVMGREKRRARSKFAGGLDEEGFDAEFF